MKTYSQLNKNIQNILTSMARGEGDSYNIEHVVDEENVFTSFNPSPVERVDVGETALYIYRTTEEMQEIFYSDLVDIEEM